MTAYDLMIKTNHHLIKGGDLTEPQKDNIVSKLLDAKSDERTKQSFYKGVNRGAAVYTGSHDAGSAHMYPIYFMDEKLTLKGKGVHGNVLWYYWLCLSELPPDLAEPEISRYKNRIIVQLNRGSVKNSDNDKANHPVMICMLRNCLCRLPEYAHIRDIQPYVSEKDGRLHFNMSGVSENEL